MHFVYVVSSCRSKLGYVRLSKQDFLDKCLSFKSYITCRYLSNWTKSGDDIEGLYFLSKSSNFGHLLKKYGNPVNVIDKYW